MNLELWNQAVDWIEDHPDDYDQAFCGLELDESGIPPTECNTPCCFMGVIGMLLKYEPEEDVLPNLPSLWAWAGKMLDITDEEAGALFVQMWPWSWFSRAGFTLPVQVRRETPTTAQAVAILRGMASDGRVWGAGE